MGRRHQAGMYAAPAKERTKDWRAVPTTEEDARKRGSSPGARLRRPTGEPDTLGAR